MFLKKYLNDWFPQDIFHDGNQEYLKYDKPQVDIFGTSYGTYYNSFNYTELGKWFNEIPLIFSVFKIFYYIPAWIIWCVTNILWVIIVVLLPKSIRNNL